MRGFIGRNSGNLAIAAVMTAVLLLVGCGDTSNMPYEPDTPAPPAHEGTFVSDHGTMTFNGDGKEITIDFDTALAEMTGLPEGEHTGTYVFLSGDLPPVGSVDVRYDVAHELAITIDETRVVVDVGIAAEDGSTASVGTNIVTTDRIPVLVKPEDKWETVMFEKK